MRIISIDPGYERLGIAILEKTNKEHLIFSECFKTKTTNTFVERLELVGKEVLNIINTYQPKVLAIENLFISTNQKTAMRVSEVRGAILYQARLSGLEIFEYTPLQIKTATTGYGKATKDQVISMVGKIIPESKNIRQDDEIDAIAIGITHFAYSKNIAK